MDSLKLTDSNMLKKQTDIKMVTIMSLDDSEHIY